MRLRARWVELRGLRPRTAQHPGDQLRPIRQLLRVDNDADFEGEKERLVFIEQYGDLGWRSHWQYLRDDYNPWNDDLMHKPWHEAQPRWFTPTIANYENGPAGFKFNPGTGLGPEYENYFFLTSAPNGQQWAFRVVPENDSWAMRDDHRIGDGIPIVGLQFSPDGALCGVDWGGGYPMNEKGAIWRIDVAKEKQHPLRGETKKLIAADFGKEGLVELSTLLGHADQRVRMKAQFELVKRGALPNWRRSPRKSKPRSSPASTRSGASGNSSGRKRRRTRRLPPSSATPIPKSAPRRSGR